MKTNKLFFILISALILIFSTGNNFSCQMSFAQEMQSSNAAPPVGTQSQVYIPSPDVAQSPQVPSPPPSNNFFTAIISMVKSLFNIIVLIAAFAGIFIVYKRIKSKTASPSANKSSHEQEKQPTSPTNVSEAVSSFVRHKIKRKL